MQFINMGPSFVTKLEWQIIIDVPRANTIHTLLETLPSKVTQFISYQKLYEFRIETKANNFVLITFRMESAS